RPPSAPMRPPFSTERLRSRLRASSPPWVHAGSTERGRFAIRRRSRALLATKSNGRTELGSLVRLARRTFSFRRSARPKEDRSLARSPIHRERAAYFGGCVDCHLVRGSGGRCRRGNFVVEPEAHPSITASHHQDRRAIDSAVARPCVA